MASLADRGISPSVVDDQHGRLTFADELARATVHLLATDAAFGTYHVSNGGPTTTWAGIAREVFALRGRSRSDVTGISTQEYGAPAPRPRHSTLSLEKLQATGYEPVDQVEALRSYLVGISQVVEP